MSRQNDPNLGQQGDLAQKLGAIRDRLRSGGTLNAQQANELAQELEQLINIARQGGQGQDPNDPNRQQQQRR